jgi:hypothetical protein
MKDAISFDYCFRIEGMKIIRIKNKKIKLYLIVT